MKTNILTLIFLILSTVQVFATGETMCSAVTKQSKIEIYLLNSRMPASPVLSGYANVETQINNRPLSLNFDAKSYELPGYWSVGQELKMFFYKENTEAKELEAYALKVEMYYNEEAMDFVGGFEVLINGQVVDQGPIFCEFG